MNIQINYEEITWQCPACLRYFKAIARSTRMPKEEAERRIIKDHIQEGCPAYLRFQKFTKDTEVL